MLLVYLATGALAGLLAGLLGIGGGIVIVPVLILVFQAQGWPADFLTHMAVATSLASIVFTSFSSVYNHHQKQAILWSWVRPMTLGIILGASVGVFTILQIDGQVLQGMIGGFAVLIALKMWRAKPGRERGAVLCPGKKVLIPLGFGVGWVSSLFGIGGGSLTVPFFTACRVNMRNAVATGAACGLPIAMVAAINNVLLGWHQTHLPEASLGYVYLPALFGISLASVVFAKLGVHWAHRVPADKLKRVFAFVLMLVGIRLLAQLF